MDLRGVSGVKIMTGKLKEELSKLSAVDLKRKQIRAQKRGDFMLASYISRLSINRKRDRTMGNGS